MSITYTKLTKKDHNAVRKLVGVAWYEEFEDNKKIYRIYTGYYLNHYVAESAYRMVVKKDGEVIGFLFGNIGKVNFFHYWKYELRVFFLGVRALFSKLGRRGIKITLITNKVNKKLKKKACHEKCAELSLFIVKEGYRNQGIGTQLEKDYIAYLKQKKYESVYVYTDTYSDFSFYDQKGYTNAAYLDVDFKIKGEETDPLPQYFIYKKYIGGQ